MLASLLSVPIIGAILRPLVDGLLSGYKAKLENQTSQEAIAAELAQRELDVQRRELELQTEYKRALIGHWYEPTNLFGYIMVIYFGKIIVWDKVLKLGVTDPITGSGAEWAGMVMAFYVGGRVATGAINSVARIIRK